MREVILIAGIEVEPSFKDESGSISSIQVISALYSTPTYQIGLAWSFAFIFIDFPKLDLVLPLLSLTRLRLESLCIGFMRFEV